MSPPADGSFPDRELDDLASTIDREARAAYRRFQQLLEQGIAPREAMDIVRNGFDARYYDELSKAFNSILDQRWTVNQLRRYNVGGMTLSRTMYRHWRETTSTVTRIVREHAQGVHQARDLALELYTGYGLRNGEVLRWSGTALRLLPAPLRELVKDPQVRQVLSNAARRASASRLRTAALRSAYLQAIDADLAGVGRARLDKLLKVAMEEKVRYFANRIAQSELARAYSDRVGRELLADVTIDVVQWRMSAAHPRADICDVFSKVDKYGLGPGCYPKRLAPRPTAHPFCRCRLRSRPDLRAANAKERPGAEREFLRGFNDHEAAQLVGSRAKLRKVLSGTPAREVWNEGKAQAHQVIQLGDMRASRKAGPGMPNPPAAPTPPVAIAPTPSAPATLDQFVYAGRQITERLGDGAGAPDVVVAELAQRLRDAGIVGKAVKVASGGQAARMVQEASKLLPSSWVEASDALGPLYVRGSRSRAWQHTVTSQLAIRLEGFGIIRSPLPGAGYIQTSIDDFGTALHELTHRIQSALPELDRVFQDLHRRRTAGTPLESLRSITGMRYGREEMTRRDSYTDPYQGKEYGTRGALEAMTIAIENVLSLAGGDRASHGRARQRFIEMYTKDREMFDLVVGLLFNWRP